MSYSGTTASSPNPPALIAGGLGVGRGSSALTGNNKNLWIYVSTNKTTDIKGSNFFSDGWYNGMRPGDIVIGTQYSSAGSSVISFVASVKSVTTAGASLATGSIMTSTFA